MTKWGLVFFLLAVPSGVLGVVDPNATTSILAQVLFFGNVVLFVVFTLLGLTVGNDGNDALLGFTVGNDGNDASRGHEL
jgi:uncharacterized membrane protein YtjA (UPF0391 family)